MSRYTLVTSIFNRLTGAALSVGLLLLIYWLMAVAGGAGAQQRAQRVLALPLVQGLYAALIIAFSYHLVAGIRHLVWDTGRGLERAQSQRSAYLVVLVSALLALSIGLCLWHHAGHAP